jgi:hypothetical protein
LVFEQLASDLTFINDQPGMQSTAVTEWFVIGGRAIGLLTKAQQELPHDIPRSVGPRLGRFGDLTHDVYWKLGYEDDAMIVTDRLYTTLLHDYEGKTEVWEDRDTLLFRDLDGEAVDRERFIGKKWLVVVDCHS